MIIGYKAIAATAAAWMLAGAGAAQAQGYYGGELPPLPYAYAGGGYGGEGYGGGGGGCGQDRFTLLGAHAGVTVLGVDLGASAHLGVPVDEECGGGAPAFQPRPYAPAPMAYGYQGYGEQGYAPPPPPQMTYGYGYPCGCMAPSRW